MNRTITCCRRLILLLGLAFLSLHAQGPAGYTFLGNEGETVILTERSHVAYGAGGSFNYQYGVLGSITLSNSMFGDPAPGQVKAGYSKAVTDESTDSLAAAITSIMEHLTGQAILTEQQIYEQKDLIAAQVYLLANDTTLMEEAIALVNYYEVNEGPMFLNDRTQGGFTRVPEPDDGKAIDRVVFEIQQGVHDLIVNDQILAMYPHLIEGLKFETSSYFPGAAEPPIDPSAAHSIQINASMPIDWGKPTAFSQQPVKRPTGCYLAAGSIGEVTVPPTMADNGYSILVGSHTWHKGSKDQIQRFNQVTKMFPIISTETQIANPFGGGIYIIVPYEATAGIVTVELTNVLRSPLFSKKPFHATTLQEWQDSERHQPGPWADFESEKFMMNVPTSWVYAYDDPVSIMDKWDSAMDGVSELLGYPLLRNNVVLYVQVDVSIAHGVYGIGYPQLNNPYNPSASTDGNSDHWFLRNPMHWATEFHELGHAQLMSMFPSHHESIVHLPHAYVNNVKFGVDLDTALDLSIGHTYTNMSRDQTAMNWMVRPNFRLGNPMDITNATTNEVRYQHKGHARYIDIAALFGWQAIIDFFHQEHLDFMAGTPSDGLSNVDSRILRLSKAAGVDLTALIHFWGVQPTDPAALREAIASDSLPPSEKIYDRLVHYRDIIPMNNEDFLDHYTTILPDQPDGGDPDYGHGWYNVWKTQYNTSHGDSALAAMQATIDMYFPDGRPVSDAEEMAPSSEARSVLAITRFGKDVIEVQLPESGEYGIYLYNIAGACVARSKAFAQRAGTRSFAPGRDAVQTGMHIVELRMGTKRVTHSAIVVR